MWCFDVSANSILCTSCDLWVHNKCSGITDHLTDHRNIVCHKCSGEIVPAAIASFKGIVKRAEPCKCDILLVSRIL